MRDTQELGLFGIVAFSLTLAAGLIVHFAVPALADVFALVFSVALSALYWGGVFALRR